MSFKALARQQYVSDSGSLKKRFSVIGVNVKRIVAKSTKDPKQRLRTVERSRIKSSPIRSGYISPKDWDYVMAITDPNASGDVLPAPDYAPDETSATSELGHTIPENQPESIEDKENLMSEGTEENGGADDHKTATERLNERWKAMRNLPAGHVHNIYCPIWKAGDTAASRPECADKTFTLFSGNPFTTAGVAYLAQWKEFHRREQD